MSFSVQNAGVVADFILFNAKLFISGSTSYAVAIRDGWIIGIGSNTETVSYTHLTLPTNREV